MTVQNTLDALRKSDFFADLHEDQLKKLLGFARELEFGAREEIFRQDGPAKDVFLIVSGTVSLVICAPQVGCREIMQVGDGDMIGWSPLLGRQRLSDTARTVTPVKVIAFDGAGLLQLCVENPQFGFDLMRSTAKVLEDRLSATRWRLLDVHGTHMPNVALESD